MVCSGHTQWGVDMPQGALVVFPNGFRVPVSDRFREDFGAGDTNFRRRFFHKLPRRPQ